MPAGLHGHMAHLGRVIGAYAEADQPGTALLALDAILAYAEQFPAPTLLPGDAVVLDPRKSLRNFADLRMIRDATHEDA